MSSILKRPGWSNYIINEKIKIGDQERTIPGWGPGKEAKRHFAGKIGQEMPIGRGGSLRKVGSTSYREAEMAFARYVGETLKMGGDVSATKEIKEVLRGVTAETLQQNGFESIDAWLDGWKTFASEKYGMDLSNLADKRVVAQISGEAEDQIESNDEGGEGDEMGSDIKSDISSSENEMTDELRAKVEYIPLKAQYADVSEDGQSFTKVSFMHQQDGSLTFVRLANVPKTPEHVAALKQVKTGSDILNNKLLSSFISAIETERDGKSSSFKHTLKKSPPEAEIPAEQEEALPTEQPNSNMNEQIRLNPRQQSMLAEQMRIARKQHLQRIEERYRF